MQGGDEAPPAPFTHQLVYAIVYPMERGEGLLELGVVSQWMWLESEQTPEFR